MTPAWPARAVATLAGGSLLLSLVTSLVAGSQTTHPPTYQRAEHLRAALASRPPSLRTRLEYSRVIHAFRAIYQTDPGAAKADASVLAAATLLTEEGRLFQDGALLRSAVSQYELLRVQYPTSSYRFSALLSEAEIYRHDLQERGEAKQRFQLFLSSYPDNPLAEQARIQLNDILAEEHPGRPAPRQYAMTPPAIEPQTLPPPVRPPPSMTPPAIQPTVIGQAQPTPLPDASPANLALATHEGSIAVVSNIRHWSTPVYTRIAIDLQNQVAYQAARVPNPDRIYFDLYGARLETGLNGKQVEVIDDGFLKRIRAAQFSNNVTRIVLDVSSVSDYSAFLLPNPWRLIIDIHGLKPGSQPTTNLLSTVVPAPNPAADEKPQGNQEDAEADTPEVSPPARKTRPPSTVQPANASTKEIASLGQQPGRIKATEHPTTQPIASSVAGTVPAPQPDDGSLASTTPPPAPAAKSAGSRNHKKAAAVANPFSAPEASGAASVPRPSPPISQDPDDTLAAQTHAAEPTAAGERSLVRTLGLKIGRIVIDAGHGGHDSGTLGPGGIQEKVVVLDVALRLGKLLKQRLGADVIFTRDNDTFIPLETRTAIANKAQADLFLSIHANSSPDTTARGVETYYLNFTTSPDALEVAARENAVSDESIHELSDLVKKITLKDKIDESREFAADVQKYLYTDLEEGNPGLRDRGVKKAPFVVLIGANMPSILAEISFLTNSDDARELQKPAYRQRIAESLFQGVSRYISGLSGVRLAQTSAPQRR